MKENVGGYEIWFASYAAVDICLLAGRQYPLVNGDSVAAQRL